MMERCLKILAKISAGGRSRPAAVAAAAAWGIALACGQVAQAQAAETAKAYLLGPEDQVRISVRNARELDFQPVRIDAEGNIRLHYIDKLRAAGLSSEQLAEQVAQRLQSFMNTPQVTVEITEYGSQPVSILGAVTRPGVHQLRGRKTLFEILSMAEGLRNDAGHSIKIMRRKEWGPIPVAAAAEDASGEFFVAEVSVKAVMEARDPQLNILIRPHDVISVPKAEMVFVVGSVRRPGGFVLGDKESVSVLQAISMAEGLDATASPGAAKILRSTEEGNKRVEIAVDVKKVLAGKEQDRPLEANDILFIPNSASKSAIMRGLEAGLQMATGVVIFRR